MPFMKTEQNKRTRRAEPKTETPPASPLHSAVAAELESWTPDPSTEVTTEIAEDLALEAELKRATAEQDSEAAAFSVAGLSVEELSACIEMLLFLSDKPISRKRLKELLGEALDFDAFDLAVEHLRAR